MSLLHLNPMERLAVLKLFLDAGHPELGLYDIGNDEYFIINTDENKPEESGQKLRDVVIDKRKRMGNTPDEKALRNVLYRNKIRYIKE